jgi:predicted nuclease of predicted toxin-antitoxin system
MKFLADENFPSPSVKLLRNSGLDVLYVLEFMRSAADQKILQFASENNLIILTFDRDYGELLFKYKTTNPAAVVYFRSFNDYPTQAAEKLLELLNLKLNIESYFTVIDSSAIRQRKL